ncbi:MAG: flagellar hook-basal body complex protein [Nitriliruptoraceae bacterium]
MLRSMFSAVSGLRSHQTMMDVVGNNISNVNTTGYKASRTTFQETLTQLIRGGTAGEADDAGVAEGAGGQNPMQIGLGTQIAATDMVFTQGASQSTGRPTDVAIQGDGFFVVREGADENVYTRAGAFSFDSAGNLTTPGGQRVLGWELDEDTGDRVDGDGEENLIAVQVNPEDYTDITIGANGTVTGRDEDGRLVDLFDLGMARFPNVEGLERAGNGLFRDSPAAGEAIVEGAGRDGIGSLQAGTLEMSNVDLAAEFTNLIMSQRGFQANARTISTSDELLQELVNLKR